MRIAWLFIYIVFSACGLPAFATPDSQCSHYLLAPRSRAHETETKPWYETEKGQRWLQNVAQTMGVVPSRVRIVPVGQWMGDQFLAHEGPWVLQVKVSRPRPGWQRLNWADGGRFLLRRGEELIGLYSVEVDARPFYLVAQTQNRWLFFTAE